MVIEENTYVEWKSLGGETTRLKNDLRSRGPVIFVDKLTGPLSGSPVITADFSALGTLPIFSITGMKSLLSDRPSD